MCETFRAEKISPGRKIKRFIFSCHLPQTEEEKEGRRKPGDKQEKSGGGGTGVTRGKNLLRSISGLFGNKGEDKSSEKTSHEMDRIQGMQVARQNIFATSKLKIYMCRIRKNNSESFIQPVSAAIPGRRHLDKRSSWLGGRARS